MSPGIVFLDHTADVGFDVEAAGPAGLFHAAALGMQALLRGEDVDLDSDHSAFDARAGSASGSIPGSTPGGAPDFAPDSAPGSAPDSASWGASAPSASSSSAPAGRASVRALSLSAPDPARLLADWLRELLFLHEVEGLDYEGAELDVLELAAPSRLEARVRLRAGGHAVREIKGVTYHEIEARRSGAGWAARVIFDV